MSARPVQIVDAVLTNGNKFLLVQSRKPSAFGLWCFPGGHVEPGESSVVAIRRELSEELGVLSTKLTLVKTSQMMINGKPFETRTYAAETEGKIVLQESELMDLKWLTKSQIQKLHDQLRSPWIIPVIDLVS